MVDLLVALVMTLEGRVLLFQFLRCQLIQVLRQSHLEDVGVPYQRAHVIQRAVLLFYLVYFPALLSKLTEQFP